MEKDIKGKLAGNKITAKRLNVEERGSLEAASKCLRVIAWEMTTWKFERGDRFWDDAVWSVTGVLR